MSIDGIIVSRIEAEPSSVLRVFVFDVCQLLFAFWFVLASSEIDGDACRLFFFVPLFLFVFVLLEP